MAMEMYHPSYASVRSSSKFAFKIKSSRLSSNIPTYRSFNSAYLTRQFNPCRCGYSPIHTSLPSFLPPNVSELGEPATALAQRLQRLPVKTDLAANPIPTGCLVPRNAGKNNVPVLLLHSFDSSCLEWRALYPILESAGVEAWALDVLGWGFTDASAIDTACSAEAKRKHIYEFWRQHIKRPALVVGTSLGGAAAIDLALHCTDAVGKLMLINAQAFAEGLGPMSKLPKFLSYAGVSVLKSLSLRRAANKMAYYNPQLATEDAMLVGRLHTHMPGWADSMVSYMQSGGYNLASKVKEVPQETTIVWGEDDKILEFDFATRLKDEIPNATLHVIKECGHVPHIEKPQEVANLIVSICEDAKESPLK